MAGSSRHDGADRFARRERGKVTVAALKTPLFPLNPRRITVVRRGIDLAVSRTAASLSLTIGVAVATLLVAGGILAGPSILECGRDGGTFGACLRAKAAGAGLIHAPVVADPDKTSSRPDGWIAADATEYVSPPPATANLTAGAGAVAADGSVASPRGPSGSTAMARAPGALTATAGPSPVSSPTDIALAAPPSPAGQGAAITAGPAGASADLLGPPGSVIVTGAVPLAPLAKAEATVAAMPGVLTTEGAIAPAPPVPARSAMIAAPGAVDATSAAPSSPPQAVAALSPVLGEISAAGDVPSTPPTAQVDLLAPPPLPVPAPTLKAELPTLSSIEQVAPRPVELVPSVIVPAVKAPPRRAASIVEKPKPFVRPVPKYNPRYPNVIVLPPPNTGADSSITTLELR